MSDRRVIPKCSASRDTNAVLTEPSPQFLIFIGFLEVQGRQEVHDFDSVSFLTADSSLRKHKKVVIR